MCRRNNEYPIPASHLYFRMSEIAGRWCSREGSPEVRIYHNEARRAGGYHVAFAYDAKTVLRRPLRQMWASVTSTCGAASVFPTTTNATY